MKQLFLAPIKWLSEILSENESGKIKASFTRVFGGYIIVRIVELSVTGKPVSAEMILLFKWVIGVQLLSKTLNSLSPAVLDLAKGYLVKQGIIQPPKDQ